MDHEAYYETTGSSDVGIPLKWPGCGWGAPTVICTDAKFN